MEKYEYGNSRLSHDEKNRTMASQTDDYAEANEQENGDTRHGITVFGVICTIIYHWKLIAVIIIVFCAIFNVLSDYKQRDYERRLREIQKQKE